MSEQSRSPESFSIASGITQHLEQRSVRSIFNRDQVVGALTKSIANDTPLRCRMVMCPNWFSTDKGRTVLEMPVKTENGQVMADESNKVIPFLTQEVPGFVEYLNNNGVKVQLLVVLADIFSTDWVHDEKEAQQRIKQNHSAIKMLLNTGTRIDGRSVFGDKDRAELRVQSQTSLVGGVEKFESSLEPFQRESLTMGTPMNKWYLHVIKQLQDMGEYGDKRNNSRGLAKIWQRALFLSSAYALDGTPEYFEKDFQRSGFKQVGGDQGHLALGSVMSPHGDIIAQGLNVTRGIYIKTAEPVGMISPFNNSLDHFWSEHSVQPTQF